MYIELVNYSTGWASLDVMVNGVAVRPITVSTYDSVNRYYYSKGDKLEIRISNYEDGEVANTLRLYDSNNVIVEITPNENKSIILDSNVSYSVKPFNEVVVVNIDEGVESIYVGGMLFTSRGYVPLPLGTIIAYEPGGVSPLYVRDTSGNLITLISEDEYGSIPVFRGMVLGAE